MRAYNVTLQLPSGKITIVPGLDIRKNGEDWSYKIGDFKLSLPIASLTNVGGGRARMLAADLDLRKMALVDPRPATADIALIDLTTMGSADDVHWPRQTIKRGMKQGDKPFAKELLLMYPRESVLLVPLVQMALVWDGADLQERFVDPGVLTTNTVKTLSQISALLDSIDTPPETMFELLKSIEEDADDQELTRGTLIRSLSFVAERFVAAEKNAQAAECYRLALLASYAVAGDVSESTEKQRDFYLSRMETLGQPAVAAHVAQTEPAVQAAVAVRAA